MTFLIRVAVTLMSIVFLIGLGYYSYYVAQETYLKIKGVKTTPMLDVKTLTNQITYWLSIGVAAVVLTMVAILAVRAAIASRRLLGVVPVADFQKHLLILGPTGSGKTNASKQAIAMAIRKGVQVVVLDWKAGGGRLTGLRMNGLFRGRHHLRRGVMSLGSSQPPPGPERRVHHLRRRSDDNPQAESMGCWRTFG